MLYRALVAALLALVAAGVWLGPVPALADREHPRVMEGRPWGTERWRCEFR
jgi:hypothetical protein